MCTALHQSLWPFVRSAQKKKKNQLTTLTDSILRTFESKYLPGRNRIVAISVLACTDKGRECISRIHREERLQLHNAAKRERERARERRRENYEERLF